MGTKYKEVGGGAAVGVSDDWASLIQSLMGGGSGSNLQFGRALGRHGQIGDILSEILGPGAGKLGGHLGDAVTRSTERGAGNIRARYGAVGGGYGSGAAQAESLYRAENANAAPLAIANLQLSALGPLLGYINQFASRGVSQRSVVAEQNPIVQGLGAAAPFIGQIAGGPIGAQIGSMFGGGGGYNPVHVPTPYGLSNPPEIPQIDWGSIPTGGYR